MNMYQNVSEYDRGVNVFSPEGRLYQVEYAIEATKLGSICIGIQYNNGCLIITEKKIISSLVITSSYQNICLIDEHIGCGVSGIVTDGFSLVEEARMFGIQHWIKYNKFIEVDILSQKIGRKMFSFTEPKTDISRPYGVALLFCSYQNNEPKLYFTNPSGISIRFKAKAIGAGSEPAQKELEEKYKDNMSFDEALKLVIDILNNIIGEKANKSNIGIGYIDNIKQQFIIMNEDEVNINLEKIYNN